MSRIVEEKLLYLSGLILLIIVDIAQKLIGHVPILIVCRYV